MFKNIWIYVNNLKIYILTLYNNKINIVLEKSIPKLKIYKMS